MAVIKNSTNGPVIGTMQYFANAGGDSTLTAQGWKKCDGSILTQTTYPALFSQVGLLNGPGVNWIAQNSTITSQFSSIHYGNGLYVAYGSSNIVTSTDAVSWTLRRTPTGQSLLAGAYGNGTHFVGGNGATMLTSTDAINWFTPLPGLTFVSSGSISGVGGGLFYNASTTQKYVWVGGVNLATSTDGNRWNAPDPGWPNNYQINSIAFGASVYVLTANTGNVATSTDGATWTARVSASTSTMFTTTFGASKFLAAGQLGAMQTSTNGIVWTSQTSGTTSTIGKVAFVNSLFIYAGQAMIATSTDAVTWTARTLTTPATTTITSVTFGASIYVYAGSGGNVATSADAITWTARTFGAVTAVSNLIFASSKFVAIGAGGMIRTSADAITWAAATSNTTSSLTGIVHDGTLFHVTGVNTHLTSTDAVTWTKNFPGINDTDSIQAAIYTDKFVIGYFNGGLQTSTNATTWTTRTSNSPNNINDFAYSGSLYVYAAGIGLMGTSTDGITWTARQTPTSSSVLSVTFGNSLWVAVNSANNLMTSTDAITWTAQIPIPANPPLGWSAVTYNSGLYVAGGVASGGQPIIYTSTNATAWTINNNISTTTVSGSIQDIISANNLFVTVGTFGLIFTSPNAYTYSTSTQFQLPTDNGLAITQEPTTMLSRSLYIKAQ